MDKRASGILLHITSLPGAQGIGTMGEEAFKFVDYLAEARQKIWQILPLGSTGFGDSPYQCFSAFAGNELLIDIGKLQEDGLIEQSELKKIPKFDKKKVQFQEVRSWKLPLLRKAFLKFAEGNSLTNGYSGFIKEHNWWLHDYALFIASKQLFRGEVWNEWEDALKYREQKALKKYSLELKDEIVFQKFLQFLFFRQWFALKNYANSKGIKIFGDIPLYVSSDSADVWANPNLFLLDEKLKPTHVGGVPPDYFSEDGQLWGNPVFNWDEMRKTGYNWWIARLHFNLKMFDFARIDHFRGLSSFWLVEATQETAINGRWIPAYGTEMLGKLKEQWGNLPLVAEDLGEIDQDVEKLRDDFQLPGMKVLQFAFSSDQTNAHLPHNYTANFIAYTGTHDNNTTKGWYKSRGKVEKEGIAKYFSGKRRKIVIEMIESIWSSVAVIAIIPFQDLLQLGAGSRMNIPGTASGNWRWRFTWKQLGKKHSGFLKQLTQKYNR